MGHMSLVPIEDIKRPPNETVYLPHHAVFKDDKIRTVFDGSTKTSSGVSLHDSLMVGPTLQRDLFSIMLAFRTFKITFYCDVSKMYRQIKVRKQDQDFQRILWRNDKGQPIQHYRLHTVTYGTSAAPFISTDVSMYVAELFITTFPEENNSILCNSYVDDFLYGSDSIEEAIEVAEQITKILDSCCFPPDKWKFNSSDFINHVYKNSIEITILHLSDYENIQKVLGVHWNPTCDSFPFSINTTTIEAITKRYILAASSRVFDPMGWLSPVTVTMKCILKHLWLQPVSWDDQLPEDIIQKWTSIYYQLETLQEIQIPRWFGTTKASSVKFNGFSDATERAYAASISVLRWVQLSAFPTDFNHLLHDDQMSLKSKISKLTPYVDENGLIRWQREYLITLQERPKWRSEMQQLQVNDLVLIMEPNLPARKLVQGRVIKIHPGKDNIVRVATIKTSSNEIQAPISELCRLPVN